ncbi:MAG: thioredoxin family protein [Candidatus Aureabacteria bacterium]|nr:thioredoxin family protein [Candidatus Auribacterota bacterium]
MESSGSDAPRAPHDDMIAEITDAHFDEEIAHAPCALLFSSPWCGTCAKMAARIESVSKQHNGVKFCTMDITRNVRKASELMVLSIPTILFFKDGEEKHRLSGDVSEQELSRGVRTIS